MEVLLEYLQLSVTRTQNERGGGRRKNGRIAKPEKILNRAATIPCVYLHYYEIIMNPFHRTT